MSQRTPTQQPRVRREHWMKLAVPTGALAVGLLIGAGVMAASTDPTDSTQYRSLQTELTTAEERSREAADRVREANNSAAAASSQASESAAAASSSAAQRAAELDAREQSLSARESAVTATEQRIAATSIGTGIWTVGVDVEPGTYRTSSALTDYCYWGIYRSGTNGDDIIENDGPKGGFPTVTLSEGQDFENSGCGTFVKQ